MQFVQLNCTFKMTKMADFMICSHQDENDGIKLGPFNPGGCNQMAENWRNLSRTQKTPSVVSALGSVSS